MATMSLEQERRVGRILIGSIIAICTCVELAFVLADWSLLNFPRLRQTTYEFAGFWPGLLRNWTPNFSGQPTVMFVSYGFLHGGLLHLIINMATLWSLGGAVVQRVGTFKFAVLYCGAIVGGAIGYTLLTTGLQPMVGASGALFGLAGGLLAWNYVDRFTHHQGLWPILQAVVLLIILNLFLWFTMSGQLAWETHLGGFITGWIIALLIDPTAKSNAARQDA